MPSIRKYTQYPDPKSIVFIILMHMFPSHPFQVSHKFLFIRRGKKSTCNAKCKKALKVTEARHSRLNWGKARVLRVSLNQASFFAVTAVN